MNKEQAVEILRQALLTIRATIQEHNLYAQALKTLATEETNKNVVNIKEQAKAE